MTREELIQTPEYWQTLYENECERLNIKPNLIFLNKINEKELDELAKNFANYNIHISIAERNGRYAGYKACYHQILEK